MSTDWPPPAFDPVTGELLDDDDAAMAAPNVAEYSVSEISGALKRTLEDTFGHIRVRGELGRVSRPASGHVYLDLKDDRAVLSGVVWKGQAARLKIQPEQGLEVIVTGRITTFEIPVNEVRRFGALNVYPRVCNSRPPTEEPKTTSFVQVDENLINGGTRRIFSGWMLAESPGLNAVEHPVYDVWLIGCLDPNRPAVPEREEAPAETAPKASQDDEGTEQAPPAD